MEGANKSTLLGIGTLLTAVGASVCCILPVAVAFLGIGSAALGAKFEPFRPYFLVLTAAFLGFAFYREYRPRKECAPGDACAVPESRRRQRAFLWIVAVVVLVLVAFPHYANWLY